MDFSLKSLLFLDLSIEIEISTFWSLFYFLFTFLLRKQCHMDATFKRRLAICNCISATLSPPLEGTSNLRLCTWKFSQKLCMHRMPRAPALRPRRARAGTVPEPRRNRHIHTSTFSPTLISLHAPPRVFLCFSILLSYSRLYSTLSSTLFKTRKFSSTLPLMNMCIFVFLSFLASLRLLWPVLLPHNAIYMVQRSNPPSPQMLRSPPHPP